MKAEIILDQHFLLGESMQMQPRQDATNQQFLLTLLLVGKIS